MILPWPAEPVPMGIPIGHRQASNQREKNFNYIPHLLMNLPVFFINNRAGRVYPSGRFFVLKYTANKIRQGI
jgi:hypothetical protein